MNRINSNIDHQEALGMMIWLMSNAEYHSQWPLWSVDEDVVPALFHQQAKFYFDDMTNPIGFVTWAWVSDDVKTGLQAAGYSLDFDEWTSGPNLYIADFVAPWGHAKAMVRDLSTNVFPNDQAFGLRRDNSGAIRKIHMSKHVKRMSTYATA